VLFNRCDFPAQLGAEIKIPLTVCSLFSDLKTINFYSLPGLFVRESNSISTHKERVDNSKICLKFIPKYLKVFFI
jgi:hypothetical protein